MASHWINGAQVGGGAGEPLYAENPATGEIIAAYPRGGVEEVEAAVAAARLAQPKWAALAPQARGAFLSAIADALEQASDDIAADIARNVGMPVKLAKLIQTNLPIATFRQAAELTGSYPFEQRLGNSRIFMEAVGVIGCITPWNYPLHQITGKVAMALAAGCVVVLKPSEIAPLCVDRLIEATRVAGLPAGVFNVVWGTGPGAGESLARSSGIDMMSFTGSAGVGRLVAQIAGAALKRTSLELGGKSASVVLPGADLKRAVKSTLSNCFLNSGQTCSAFTRLLVQRDSLRDAIDLARESTAAFKVGDPFDPDVRMGPLISALQRDRVMSFIAEGRSAGAELVCGGGTPSGLSKGYFVEPTVFADVDPSSVIAQKEIFGPVLSIISYGSVDEAVEIANGTEFGLAGGVWASDTTEAEAVARRLHTGQVDINGGKYNPLAPFGGVKSSGYGREMGVFGLREFTESKSFQY